MNATVLDLRKSMKGVLSALRRNERVTLTYRGKKTATIVPVSDDEKPISVLDHEAFGMWQDDTSKEDVDQYVRELRKGRKF